MVKALLAGVALCAFGGCQLALDQGCPDGGGCPNGAFCGPDLYCHPSQSGTSTSGTVASGTGSGTSGTGGRTGTTGAGQGATSAATPPALTCVPGDAGAPTAVPLSVSGTIAIPADGGVQAGQLYVSLFDPYGGVLCGTSFHVCGPGTFAYTLHGVPVADLGTDGGYPLAAWLDTYGAGTPLPGLQPSARTVVSLGPANAVRQNLVLAPPPMAVPQPVTSVFAALGNDGGALVIWSPPDGGGAAETYAVCVGPAGTPLDGGLCQRFPPGLGNTGVAIVSGVKNVAGGLQAAVAEQIGGVQGPFVGSLLSSTVGTDTLSGPMSGAPAGAAIDVLAFPEGDGLAAFYLDQEPAGARSYAFANLPSGTYQVFAFADVKGTGEPFPGDPVDFTVGGNLPTCLSGQTDCAVTFAAGDAIGGATVATSAATTGPAFQVAFQLLGNLKLPVSAAVLQTVFGQTTDLLDLPLLSAGNEGNGPLVLFAGTLALGLQTPSTPYTVAVTYADQTTEQLALGSSSYFTSVPQIAIDAANGTVDWTAPSGDSNGVSYSLQVYEKCGGNITDFDGGYTGSAAAGFSLGVSNVVGTEVTAIDANGNTAQNQLSQCYGSAEAVAVTGTVLYDGGAKANAPIYVTLSEGVNGPPLAGATVTAAAPNFLLRSPAGGNTLTAWMDTLGSGRFVPSIDPSSIQYDSTNGETGGLGVRHRDAGRSPERQLAGRPLERPSDRLAR